MIDITQIRTHGRLAKTLKPGDVIVKQTFHGVFAEVVDVEPDRFGLMFVLRGLGGDNFVHCFGPDERVDLVVWIPEVETPFGPAREAEEDPSGDYLGEDPWPGPTPEALEQVGHERANGEDPVVVTLTYHFDPENGFAR